MLIGSVGMVITLLMMLLVLLGTVATATGCDELKPVAIKRTIDLIDAQAKLVGIGIPRPCDGGGSPR